MATFPATLRNLSKAKLSVERDKKNFANLPVHGYLQSIHRLLSKQARNFAWALYQWPS